MNIADKMEMEAGLRENLASWMREHGTVLSDRTRSNAYTDVRICEVRWQDRRFRIVYVDGMACEITQVYKRQNNPVKSV